MFSNNDPVIQKIDLLLAERQDLRASGPHFRIVHRFCIAGSDCMPGEEIAAVYLIHRSAEFRLPLSLALRILFDFMARYRRLPQSAVQIAAAIGSDPFCTQHGTNAECEGKLTRNFAPASIKVYIERLRRALDVVLQEAHLNLDPTVILRSEKTVSNEVGYQLKASCEWLHIQPSG